VALTITRIPERYRVGFAKLKLLTPQTVTSILQVVEQLPPTSKIKDMVSAITSHLPSVGREDAEVIVRTLYSLYVFRADAGPETTLSELVTSIVVAMQASGKDSLALQDKEKAEFQDNLTRLLGSTVLERSSKIQQLKTDYETLFYDAKILTDIRPLFADPKERPVSATITHTLKIVCHEAGGEHKELYFALSSEHIQTIKKVVERAEAKEESLRSLLKDMKLTDLS